MPLIVIPGFTPIPKPAKGRSAGIVTRDDGREICRTSHQWQKRRKEKHDDAGGRCERCGGAAPLHDVLHPETGELLVYAGEAHHKVKRKMGGGARDDRKENLEWLDRKCHVEEHMPKKVVPRKER